MLMSTIFQAAHMHGSAVRQEASTESAQFLYDCESLREGRRGAREQAVLRGQAFFFFYQKQNLLPKASSPIICFLAIVASCFINHTVVSVYYRLTPT